MVMGILIGYFPKRRARRSGWVSPYPDHPDAPFPAPAPVEEICSVSDCIAKGLDSRMFDVPFNDFGGFDSPASACQAVAPEERGDFELFAYRLIPILFREGREEELAVPPLDRAPLPDTFERLGYDAVELAAGCSLGCSPLSCNGQTWAASVNRHCLVETEQEGEELARAFSVSKPEPGPYCAVEVWRETGTAGSGAAPDA